MKNENASIRAVLCSRLCAQSCRPLEPSEWNRLASMLGAKKLQPKDIPDFSDDEMSEYFGYGEEQIERVKRLLDRAGSLAFEFDRLFGMGIGILTRADKEYPRALRVKLKGICPPLLYFAGDLSLLEGKTIGFVGSRAVGEEDIAFEKDVVEKVNRRGYGVVSGGAKGADSAAREASISNGSFCIEYIPDTLSRRVKKKDFNSAIRDDKLLLLSAAIPDASFSAGMAMQRNKFIYAQSSATVVIRSDYNKGGTWGGASEALKKGYCTVFCRSQASYPGNMALIKLGAVPINESWNGDINYTGGFKPDEGVQLTIF